MSAGVYQLPYEGPGGEKVFVAVDAAGHKAMEMTVVPGVDTAPLERLLWTLLESERPRLALVE